MMQQFIHQPDGESRLGDLLNEHFYRDEWKGFCAAVAFVKRSGVRHIFDGLSSFSQRAHVKILVGVDQKGTSVEGLKLLLDAVGVDKAWVCHNEFGNTFHPKVFLFYNDAQAFLIVGSGNWTEGGLFSNYEAHVALLLDLNVEDKRDLFNSVIAILDSWSDPSRLARPLTPEFLDSLSSNGYILTESQMRQESAAKEEVEVPYTTDQPENQEPLFRRVSYRRAPVIKRPILAEPAELPADADERLFEVTPIEPAPPQDGEYLGFVMLLQKTDVGIGQVTAGTSRRSPEIFVPLAARNHAPAFWGWQDQFVEDPAKPGKFDRTGVLMRIGANIISVNMMTWPDKSDFRLRSEAIRSAGNIGDILRLERAGGIGGFSYYVEIIPAGTADYDRYLEYCVNTVRNSQKLWGYY